MKNKVIKKFKYRLTSDFKKHLVKPLTKKKTYDLSKNHYIFADPRGGSTWLMEIIQIITNEPVIWEPLNLNLKNNPFNSLNFDWRQYIPAEQNWPEAEILFKLLFQGEILNDRILDYSKVSQVNSSESLLFKICRGNAMLPWLVEHFDFKYKPLFMVRHPIAVASSQLRHGAWSDLSNKFIIPETPYNDHYKKHKKFLKSLTSIEETLVAKWCLHNLYTLNHENNNKKWITICYEDFVSEPKVQINRILDQWKADYDISRINFSQNSATTLQDSPKLNIDKISNWQNYFSENQKANMKNVLDYFDIKIYSIDSGFPKLD